MKKRISLFVLAIVIASLSAVGVAAQQPSPASPPNPSQQPNTAPPKQPGAPRGPRDPLHDSMFPPEMIMQHQRELGLTDEQKTYMRGEINKTTTRFNELQWQLQDAMEALHATMKENTVNEQLALSQLDKVLENERDIKRLHMELAIRIKNKLTPDQQTKLHEMRRGPRAEGGPGHGPGHGPGAGTRPPRPGGPGAGPGAPRTPQPNEFEF